MNWERSGRVENVRGMTRLVRDASAFVLDAIWQSVTCSPDSALTHWEALNLPDQTGDRSVLSYRDFCVFNPFLLLRPATRLHKFTGASLQGKTKCEKDLLKVHPPVVPSVFLHFHLTARSCWSVGTVLFGVSRLSQRTRLFSESYNFLTSCCVLHGYDVMLRR